MARRFDAVEPRHGNVEHDDIRTKPLRLGEELKRDEKERSEHVMLVDLGRNDLGRVCAYGSVRVPQFMTLERYSHVMHLVSRVVGTLADDADRLDDAHDHVGRRLRTLEQCALHKRTLRLTCPACGRSRVMDAAALWWLFRRKGWDDALPGVAPIADTLKGFSIDTWWGLVAPAGTPSATIARLNQAFVTALNAPETRNRFAGLLAEPAPDTPEQFGAFMKSELAKYRDVVKATGARVD